MSDVLRPRLLWVTNFDAPYRRPIWEALSNAVDLTVVFTGDRDDPEAANRGHDWFDHTPVGYRVAAIRQVRPRLKGRTVNFSTAGVRSLVAGADAVVVAGWEAPVYWQFAAAARRQRKRLVGFYESTGQSQQFTSGPIATARRRYFQRLDAVVTPGVASADAVRALGVPTDRIVTGFNPVDVDRFHDAAKAARSDLGSGSGPAATTGHRFIYVGQLIERKNVLGLVEAFSLAWQLGWSLTIVGRGDQGDAILASVGSSGAADQIDVVGEVDYADLPALLSAHHTLVLPSTEEVWGLVVNEALAAGLQAVVSDRAGVAADVASMDGVWVTPVEVPSLARALTAAADAWTGPIPDPAVLAHSPSGFADVFRQAAFGAHPTAAR